VLRRVLALTELQFSNSLIEAFWLSHGVKRRAAPPTPGPGAMPRVGARGGQPRLGCGRQPALSRTLPRAC
jgi:hypothetical protein